LISVAGVTVGTAAMVIALALATGFQLDMRQRIASGSAHLTVMSTAQATFVDVVPLVRRLEDFEGVAAASPVLFGHGMLVNEGAGKSAYVEIMGVDPDRHGLVIRFGGMREDPFVRLARPSADGRDGLLVGDELASRLGVRRGDLLRALVPRVSLTPFSAMPRSRLFESVGTFHAEAYPLNLERAYIGIEPARRLMIEPDRASWIELRVERVEDLERVKEALREELGPSWSVIDMLEQNRQLLKALQTEKAILFLAIALIVVVASLNIVSTLILMVHDKIKEIGTLSAMGATSREIATVFILQGTIIGIAGTAAGLSLGAGLSWWLDRYRVIQLNPEVYFMTHVPFAVQTTDLAFVATIVMAISFLATIYPAWRAARLDPVEAIRYE
jgi:lipoprotein-releasing system permease protein